jgi:hypothetical protein
MNVVLASTKLTQKLSTDFKRILFSQKKSTARPDLEKAVAILNNDTVV